MCFLSSFNNNLCSPLQSAAIIFLTSRCYMTNCVLLLLLLLLFSLTITKRIQASVGIAQVACSWILTRRLSFSSTRTHTHARKNRPVRIHQSPITPEADFTIASHLSVSVHIASASELVHTHTHTTRAAATYKTRKTRRNVLAPFVDSINSTDH